MHVSRRRSGRAWRCYPMQILGLTAYAHPRGSFSSSRRTPSLRKGKLSTALGRRAKETKQKFSSHRPRERRVRGRCSRATSGLCPTGLSESDEDSYRKADESDHGNRSSGKRRRPVRSGRLHGRPCVCLLFAISKGPAHWASDGPTSLFLPMFPLSNLVHSAVRYH
jgi:hypothetical protein